MAGRKRSRHAAGKGSKSTGKPATEIIRPTADQIFWAGVRAITEAENETANALRAARRNAEQRDQETPGQD